MLLHRTYYEGDDDGSVLLALATHGLLPEDLDIVQKQHRKKNPGKDGMVKDIAALVEPVGGPGLSAIAVRDIDEHSQQALQDWFIKQMTAELREKAAAVAISAAGSTGQVLSFEFRAHDQPHVGRVVLVPAGLPGGLSQTDYGIERFAIDDFVLLLVREQPVYKAFSELDEVPYTLAWKKMSEITAIMKDNGIPIKHAKRLMHLFRAVAGFRASSATFADRAIDLAVTHLGLPRVRELFLPLIERLEEASKVLSSKSGPGAPAPAP
jgi:hypothetical protein